MSSDSPDARDTDLQQALALHRAGRLAEAIARYRDILDREPEWAAAWTNLAVALRAHGRSVSALACIRRAHELEPGNAGIAGNLGNLLKDLGRFDEAVAVHGGAVAATPDDPKAHYNLALSLKFVGDREGALAAVGEACRLNPEMAQAHVDRAMLLLEAGELEAAWPDYEHRYALPEMTRHRFEGERWTGEPFPGRTLLVHREQGLGDAIFAARFLAAAKARGGEVWLQCPEPLRRLFAGMPGVDRLVGSDELPDGADLHCGLLSLPGRLGTRAGEVPAPARLCESEALTAAQSRLLERAGDRFRVGVFWSGNPRYKGNPFRAAPLQPFLELARQPQVQLISLQTGPPRAQLGQAECDPIVLDAADVLGDFASTAAFVRQLDLVIMTDSALAHLCGSLGRPVWLLLGIQPYWVFGTEHDRTPWYPSMRLFRLAGHAMWGELFEVVADRLGDAVTRWREGSWPARGDTDPSG